MERRTQEIQLPGGERMLAAVTLLRPEPSTDRGEGEDRGGERPYTDGGSSVSDLRTTLETDRGRAPEPDHGGAQDALDRHRDHAHDRAHHRDGGYEYEDTGALDTLASRVQGLNELVSGVGSAVLEAARATRPDEVAATFGVEFAAKAGRAVAMLADGEAKGSISVTLTWRLDGSQGTAGPGPAAGPPGEGAPTAP
ncbi:hypothetical protein LHJ74_18235 [Streptomyces sp. N2-109]|uniref:Trypsin-co-occurring domain-containing protein n=1 Tax=Streptomyces gossypii TaxID=2883101 RepID=A0ABT2JV84_9ACTN|nr:CU044_2847 family protein [Streptomyces gossypii]MCT2591812.1 hypothetical protein [Streptomyces gossypii]